MIGDQVQQRFTTASDQIVPHENPGHGRIGGDGLFDVSGEVLVVSSFRKCWSQDLTSNYIPIGRRADRTVTNGVELLFGDLSRQS